MKCIENEILYIFYSKQHKSQFESPLEFQTKLLHNALVWSPKTTNALWLYSIMCLRLLEILNFYTQPISWN